MNERPSESTDRRAQFLRRHAPFDAMGDEALRRLAPRFERIPFARDEVLLSPRDGPVAHLFVVESGAVGSRPETMQGEVDRVYGPGEAFPIGALAAGGATTRSFVAASDGACLRLSREDFLETRRSSPEFERFCADAVTETLRTSLERLYAQYRQREADEGTLATPIGELVRNPPVSCPADAPLAQAVQRMGEGNVRTVVAVDPDGAPVGMFTLVDLLHRVVLAGRGLDRPLSEAMSSPVHALAPAATAIEAMQTMAEHGIRQVIVVDEGRVRGVVSERDLAALQRVSVRQVSARLLAADSIEKLGRAARDVRSLGHTLLAQGVGTEQLTRTISALNDALSRRAIELVRARHDVCDFAWCWLSLGSEGRGEQTFVTDQDNALVFRPGEGQDPARPRERLLAFARDVNDALDAIGFDRCPGNVMASNPELCLSMEEWRAKFLGWLLQPTPQALLGANIVFDFRPLFGEATLASELRDWLSARSTTSTIFLRLMAANALQVDPPLGLIRSFVLDDRPDAKGTLDLKVRGTRIFVDAARVWALAHGIAECGTAQRLRLAGSALRFDARDVDAAVEAFEYLQLLRMRQQSDGEGHAAANRIDPYALNELDQRMLREAFRQARQLQERLRSAYRL